MKPQKEKISLRLLQEIYELDTQIYDATSEITLDWYLERYTNLSFCIVLRNSNGELVGYSLATGINDSLYQYILSGQCQGDIDFNKDSYTLLETSKHLYGAPYCVKNELRNAGWGTQLLQTLFLAINEVNKDYEDFIVLATHGSSEHLLSKMNFSSIKDDKYNVMIHKGRLLK